MAISTRNLSKLTTNTDRLKEICQAIATLDAILMPEWDSRYYSFDLNWGKGESVSSMRNGLGDEFYILFNEYGAIIKGYDHESPMGKYIEDHNIEWQAELKKIPKEFFSFMSESAFKLGDATFIIWKRNEDKELSLLNIGYPEGMDPDGSEYLLSILEDDPQIYHKWAEKYYERNVNLNSVEKIYKHEPLKKDLLISLNPKAEIKEVLTDIKKLGYPVSSDLD